MALLIEAAIAKTGKYASRESGDSAELVERPGGGVSIVVIDGQGSGPAARSLSLWLSAHAVALVKDGVRDGVVARAVHDRLFAFRQGQVSATLDIVSVDLRTKTLLVTRNAGTPLLIGRGHEVDVAPCRGEPIGRYLRSRPAVWEVPLETDLRVAVCTDGVAGSGTRQSLEPFDLCALVRRRVERDGSARDLADALLAEAVRRDDRRPSDDMTAVALAIRAHDDALVIRRQQTVIPLP